MKRIGWILAMGLIVLCFSGPALAEEEELMCPGDACENSYECQQIVYCTYCDRTARERICKN